MGNLFAVLGSAGQALGAYQRALSVVQNNLSNSNTPGYASQSANLVGQPFDITAGLVGGVAAKGLISARDQFADGAVQQQLQLLGKYTAQAQGTSSISNFFDATGNTGVTADLNTLFQSFSAWSLTPNSATSQQSVLASAGTLAAGIQSLSKSLNQTDQNAQGQINSTVQQVNQLTARIQQYNVQRRSQAQPDPNLDAQLNSDLEQLSQLVDFSSITQADGSVTVVLSGGSPLVVGDTQYALSSTSQVPAGSANPSAPPSSIILDNQGNDITSQITGGQLGGLLDVHNNVLASIIGSGSQAGSLNTFAKSVADTVNGILTSGTVSTQVGAAAGTALFSYNNTDPTLAASTFAVNPAITPAGLAPVDSKGNSNGNALALASLANSTASGGIGGQTFGDYFSGIESALGNAASTAQTNQQAQQQVADQTKAQRDQISGVSLDQQATLMMQFQNSYQAAAQFINVLDQMSQATINMIH